MGTVQKTSTDDDVARHWQQLSGDFYRIAAALDRALEREHQLSGSEFDVLERLANADRGQLRMSELAPEVALSQSALSRLVGRLETSGLVRRIACTDDRRSVYARITGDGAKLYDAAKPTQRAALRAASLGCEVGDLLCDGRAD
ncbi:MAG: MarR family transcriptional regulator [Nocardioides sp.]|uniref:MarR family winged helix-turn-helix transcriptional regulator n=1 Tax=Nocardioides sp. TaxID=35761 RepID=UPI0039E51C19